MEGDETCWTPTLTGKKMLLAGWCGTPRKCDGLLEDQIISAMKQVDVDLSKVMFNLNTIELCPITYKLKLGGEGKSYSALAVLSRV
jgi:hypothetical protein